MLFAIACCLLCDVPGILIVVWRILFVVGYYLVGFLLVLLGGGLLRVSVGVCLLNLG